MINLDEIEARASAATPGPWYATDQGRFGSEGLCGFEGMWGEQDAHDSANNGYTVSRAPEDEGWRTDGGHPGYTICKHDAAFIAAARTDVPALIAEVRALRDVLRSIEFVDTTNGEAAEVCPSCLCKTYGPQPPGMIGIPTDFHPGKHAPGCRLAGALGP